MLFHINFSKSSVNFVIEHEMQPTLHISGTLDMYMHVSVCIIMMKWLLVSSKTYMGVITVIYYITEYHMYL